MWPSSYMLAVWLLLNAVGTHGVVHLPVQAVQGTPAGSRMRRSLYDIMKRQHTLPIPNEYFGFDYIINVTIGSDKQTVPALFDTGSSELIINPDCKNADEPMKAGCYKNSRYHPSTSRTARILKRRFNITYGSGTISGYYVKDNMRFGSAAIKGQQFGVGLKSELLYVGIIGIQPNWTGNASYRTFIDTLVDQGKIDSLAFSLDLRTINETGSVTFGGLDTKKYKCKLRKVPALGHNLNLTGFAQSRPNEPRVVYNSSIWNPTNRTRGLSILIDSGASVNLMPAELFGVVGVDYPNATFVEVPDGNSPYWRVPCDAPPGTFDFSFDNGVTIKVPYKEMIMLESGECQLGIRPRPPYPVPGVGYVPSILGSSFLRGAYVVFDMANSEIWLGEAANCGSNIVPIGKGKNSVPIVAGCGCKASTSSAAQCSYPTSSHNPY